MDETTPKGKLEVILGPAFSGKTSELIRRMQRYYFAGFKCLLIRFSSEDGYTKDSLTTHDGYMLNGLKTSNLLSIQHFAAEFDVIGIDEAHYFTDVVDFCLNASDNGKKIIAAALDGNCQRLGFSHVLGLIPLAENVNKLTSICMCCLNEAPFTREIHQNGSQGKNCDNIELISVCQDCYFMPLPVKRCQFQECAS